MDTHDFTALGNPQHAGGPGRLHALIHRQIQGIANKALAAGAQQHRIPPAVKLLQLLQAVHHLKIALHSLAKADARVQNQLVKVNTGLVRYLNGFQEK